MFSRSKVDFRELLLPEFLFFTNHKKAHENIIFLVHQKKRNLS